MKRLTLNDGHHHPAIGFGTYQGIGEEGIKAVTKAIEIGYRLIDTAAVYRNEEEVGEGIRRSGISREEIIITSKLARTKLGATHVKKELEKSLNRLQVEYLDLYLIHWPANAINFENWAEINIDTWKAMEEAQQEGKIRSIGVSNFWQEHLDPILENCEIIPSVNQIEFHPGYRQAEVVQYCSDKGILIEGWSPLAKGQALKNGTIRRMAKKYGKTEAQVCLRWAIEQNIVPIPKSVNPERITENFQVFDFQLSGEDVHALNQMPQMGFSGELPNDWRIIKPSSNISPNSK